MFNFLHIPFTLIFFMSILLEIFLYSNHIMSFSSYLLHNPCPQIPLVPCVVIAVPIIKAISVYLYVFPEHPFSLIQHLHAPSPSFLPLLFLLNILKIWSHFHIIMYFSWFLVLPNLNQTPLANFKESLNFLLVLIPALTMCWNLTPLYGSHGGYTTKEERHHRNPSGKVQIS